MNKVELKLRAEGYARRVRPDYMDGADYETPTMKGYRDGWTDAEARVSQRAQKWLDEHIGQLSFVDNWFTNDKLVNSFLVYIKE